MTLSALTTFSNDTPTSCVKYGPTGKSSRVKYGKLEWEMFQSGYL